MTDKISKRICLIVSGCAILLYSLLSLGQLLFSRPWDILFSYRSVVVGMPHRIAIPLFVISLIVISIMILTKKIKYIVAPLSIIFILKLYITMFNMPLKGIPLLHIVNICSLISAILIILISLNIKYINDKLSKTWFIPALLELLYLVIVAMNFGMFFFQPYLFLFKHIIYCVAIGFLTLSFIAVDRNIKATEKNTNGTYYSEKNTNTEYGYCDMTKHVLLLVFLGWIWQYIWIYRTTDYLNTTPNEEKRDPIKKLLLCMFVPFYYIYWIYQSARRIEILAREKNIDSDIVMLCTVLSFFVGIIPPILMQIKINQICKCEEKPTYSTDTNTVHQKVETNSDKTDEIRNYKKLLDDGIITEQEFEAKKKQLLDL